MAQIETFHPVSLVRDYRTFPYPCRPYQVVDLSPADVERTLFEAVSLAPKIEAPLALRQIPRETPAQSIQISNYYSLTEVRLGIELIQGRTRRFLVRAQPRPSCLARSARTGSERRQRAELTFLNNRSQQHTNTTPPNKEQVPTQKEEGGGKIGSIDLLSRPDEA